MRQKPKENNMNEMKIYIVKDVKLCLKHKLTSQMTTTRRQAAKATVYY